MLYRMLRYPLTPLATAEDLTLFRTGLVIPLCLKGPLWTLIRKSQPPYAPRTCQNLPQNDVHNSQKMESVSITENQVISLTTAQDLPLPLFLHHLKGVKPEKKLLKNPQCQWRVKKKNSQSKRRRRKPIR